MRVPTVNDLREIESSSRLAVDGEVLHLSMPMITGGQGRAVGTSPLGLVLSPRYLLTVRFAPITPIDDFAAQFSSSVDTSCSFGAFVSLLEIIVDQIADALETIRVRLDEISHEAFEVDEPKHANLARIDATLRKVLRSIGRSGEHTSN